jgi:C4-dicarboxylate-specific signal transduction histidine kinase
LPADIVGAPFEYDFAGTIRQALLWHPGTRRLVVVTGVSPRDHELKSRIRDGIARLELVPTVEYLSGLSTDAVEKRLSELGKGDVVVTPGYFKDGTGRAFVPRDSAALMAAASHAPVYGPYSTFIGTGVVGGRMVTFVDMGREAAKSVNALLDGTPSGALPLPASVQATLQVDWRQARRWDIDPDAIPADATLHFREPTFWEAYRNVAILAIAIFLLQAALIGALLFQRNLRRRTAAALAESEKRMSLAAHAARLSMWSWDATTDKVWAATQLRRGSDVPQHPIAFADVLKAAHPADREELSRAVGEALATGEELDVEYRLAGPTGDERWIAARGRSETGSGQRLLGVAIDITERKVAELRAAGDRAALRHMTRVSMLGQLSASIAHQLNQPLAAILGNAEAAQKMLSRDRVDLGELREICNDIVTEDNRAAEVIRRLGALYKRGDMKMEPLDLNKLVRETLDLLRTELLTRHVAPVTDFAAVPPLIDGGHVQLQQVLLNLVINAADAMSGVKVEERSLVIRTESYAEDVRLYVVDNGSGIAPDDLTTVFDAFWSTKDGGMGMGLAICKSIVVAHHGSITATNNPDGGATFCVILPVRKSM